MPVKTASRYVPDRWDENAKEGPIEPSSIFNVTVKAVIGTVEVTKNGNVAPHEAALRLIGSYGEDGEYVFPTFDGGTCTVVVKTRGPESGQTDRA